MIGQTISPGGSGGRGNRGWKAKGKKKIQRRQARVRAAAFAPARLLITPFDSSTETPVALSLPDYSEWAELEWLMQSLRALLWLVLTACKGKTVKLILLLAICRVVALAQPSLSGVAYSAARDQLLLFTGFDLGLAPRNIPCESFGFGTDGGLAALFAAPTPVPWLLADTQTASSAPALADVGDADVNRDVPLLGDSGPHSPRRLWVSLQDGEDVHLTWADAVDAECSSNGHIAGVYTDIEEKDDDLFWAEKLSGLTVADSERSSAAMENEDWEHEFAKLRIEEEGYDEQAVMGPEFGWMSV